MINIEEISQHSLQLEEDYFGSMPKDFQDGGTRSLGSRSSRTELDGEEKVEELDSPERSVAKYYNSHL